jgi:hypothetical protein
VVASFVLTVALGIFFIVRTTREAVRLAADDAAALHDAAEAVMWAGPSVLWQLVMNFEVLTFLARPIVWPAAVALWAYPLAVALLRRGGGLAGWGSLEPPGVTLPPARLRVGQAALIGAIGAVLAYLVPLLLRAVVHARVPVATRDQDPFALGFSFWLVVLALVLQALVAAVVAARTEEAAVVHGLFAAMITGAGATLAIATQPSLASCVEPISVRPSTCEWLLDGDTLRFTFEQVAGEGVLAALLGAGIAVGLRAAVRRLRTAGAPEAPSRPATT